jgi:predicted GIY-YIG superfamily endonuclease
MPFWTYMLHCADRSFYVGHTDDLDSRIAQHEQGTFGGYTHERRPVKLVWCNEFPSRYEALSAERQIKGWSRAKKLALIREDWDAITQSAKNRAGKERASTGSARTGGEGKERGEEHSSNSPVRPEPVEGRPFVSDGEQTRLAMKLHPTCVCDALTGIEVTLSRRQGFVNLLYVVGGTIAGLLIPAPASPRRRDGLWRHSCFEAFVRAPGEAAYGEFNFAPSGEWAAYRFDAYRTGMEAADVPPPSIRTRRDSGRLEVQVSLEVGAKPLRLALSAVIEETNGRNSYWALAHPAAKPDFHHPDSFVHELP